MAISSEIVKDRGGTDTSTAVTLTQLQEEVEELAQQVRATIKKRWQQQYEYLQSQAAERIQELRFQAEQVNTLSAQMEQEIIKLIDSLFEVEKVYQSLPQDLGKQTANEVEIAQLRPSLYPIWKIEDLSVPTVDIFESVVVLTTRGIDLSSMDSSERNRLNSKSKAELKALTSNTRK